MAKRNKRRFKYFKKKIVVKRKWKFEHERGEHLCLYICRIINIEIDIKK